MTEGLSFARDASVRVLAPADSIAGANKLRIPSASLGMTRVKKIQSGIFCGVSEKLRMTRRWFGLIPSN